MAGLVPAIHVFLAGKPTRKTWMPATSAGMTAERSFGLTVTRDSRPNVPRSRIAVPILQIPQVVIPAGARRMELVGQASTFGRLTTGITG